jgi:regulator of Ty1 transposition protein 109
MTTTNTSLAEAIAQSLRTGIDLTYYHISTPPTPCEAIYAAPLRRRQDRTYSESHSLLVTTKTALHDGQAGEVAIYAIELILYTTSHLSTLFVSKADSSGYASTITSSRGSASILRSLTSTFIAWLVSHRHRPDRRLVLSLFARAQGQYLFPGSVENGKKHVLDDRQLVKWWCKTLDPVARKYGLDITHENDASEIRTRAYLIVPGHDSHETAAFFPPSSRVDASGRKLWLADHPLRIISHHSQAPPRCLIPQFPDDPKARFLSELDEEIPDAALSQQSQMNTSTSPTKKGAGVWRSVKTLETFWEMMAYRQECSSGRLVGFIWVVFTPSSLHGSDLGESQDTTMTQKSSFLRDESPSPLKRKAQSHTLPPPAKKKKVTRLTGPILPRAPRIKPTTGSCSSSCCNDTAPETTKYYHSPHSSRGTLVLAQKDYDRVHEILLRLDFSSLPLSCTSTKKWISESAVVARREGMWGVEVNGLKTDDVRETGTSRIDGAVNVLAVKRKAETEPATSMLNSGLVRKKPKVVTDAGVDAPIVNVIGAGLVRKKPKE